jgi:prepilin-type N-terminal cleavage/methylation domain-containing protein
MHYNKQNGGGGSVLKVSQGFTLAEVLITLGIIGIVAALTMPALVSNYRKNVVETKLKRFYSNINQAVKLSEVDHGDPAGWTYPAVISIPACDWYDEYINPYLRTTNVVCLARGEESCASESGCVEGYFLDGSIVRFSYYGSDIRYYVSKKDDTAVGKDTFMFGFYPTRVLTSGANKDAVNTHFFGKGVETYVSLNVAQTASGGNQCAYDGSRESLKGGNWCYTELIRLNGWQIPDDYPIKF